jgi:serine/threonine protein kinase/sugar lactone lactonase YvrE
MKAGDQFGAWELVERLGGGGNGDVWKARHEDGREGAVKLLRRAGRNRRARFRAEIDFLLNKDPGPGVLPLIDFSLPDAKSEPAWYVMPLARLLREALGQDTRIEERVGALLVVARTLARLAEREIGHRDIKPENLFERDGEYLVGDFGLVTYPEKDPVTRSGRRLGPTDYLAPEMRVNADTADAQHADVYSLAKTTWVVLSGRAPPLPGPHRIEDDAYRLGTYLTYPRLDELDLLLERCTRHVPQNRPSMAEVANELEAWLKPHGEGAVSTLDDIADRVKLLSERGLRAQAAVQRQQSAFQSAWAEAHSALMPIHDRLQQVFPAVDWHRNPAAMTDFGHRGSPPAIRQQHTYGLYATNADPEAVRLFLCLGAQWVAADEARWAAWIRIEDTYAGSRTLWTSAAPAPLGSAQQRRVISDLIHQLESRLREAASFALARMELRTDAENYAAWTGEDTDAGPLEAPWSVFSPHADGDTGCYVVDSGNNRIVRFGPGGRPLDWLSSGGPGKDYGNLHFPTGGCFDHDRYIWIADHDNQRLRRFDEHGRPVEGFGLEPPGAAVLQGPADVASGPDGSVYVADRRRHSVVKFSAQGHVLTEWGGRGRTPGNLSVPCGIAVRHGAFVYVSDSGNDRIQKFTSNGELVLTWGSQGTARGCFHAPHGIALDSEENVYVADSENHRIQQFTSDGAFVGSWGSNGGDGSPGTAPERFVQPRGVSVDGTGSVYVAEFGSARVQRFGPRYLAAL